MNQLLARNSRISSGDSDPTSQVFAEYMSNIILKLPNPGQLSLLRGTANGQASFYFKSSSTGEINATLYNALIAPRVSGAGTQYGVPQVTLLGSTFINAYTQLYTSLRYRLSQADRATMQQLIAEVSNSVSALRGIWNAWVSATPDTKVPKLDMNDTQTALMQLTATMTSAWLNPGYKEKLHENPAYPYQHMSDFDQIFSGIPLSVPMAMRNEIKAVYNAQGAQGGLTAKVSNATQTLQGILDNVQHASKLNGGLKLTGSDNMIPGIMFQPADPLTLVNELDQNPPTTKARQRRSKQIRSLLPSARCRMYHS